ncbi:hypothetical protein EJ08DRAFT_452928 [Tothia fuscella]|uniref:Sucrose transport protein n=1 Tax=Tothia fuscella TaxID=1048955 RepID=A0A9P4NIJ5_9PEZI|nr:hypothetical protein EJ08DRAFT_452928 [Tothia fuscella]
MTYCTPYLLRLGLTKSMVSLVWIAGPLSGMIMHPVIGIIADRSTNPYGRRRPFMLIGTFFVCISLWVLGWTTEIVGLFIEDKDRQRGTVIALAVVAIYGIDFAVNVVQACCRSLIVDSLPIPKQQLGSAWASRMVAIGSLIGYGFGALDLGAIFGTSIGDTQFKQLIVVSAVSLCTTVGLTCFAVTERVLVTSGKDEGGEEGFGALAMLTQIYNAASNPPENIAAICRVQFWCWIGWFPFLFYSTTWIGEVYLRFNAPADAHNHPDSLGQIGRVGSQALVAFSIITFASSVFLPWFIDTPSSDEESHFTPRPPESIAWLVTEASKWRPDLVSAWSYSHVIFAGSMVMAPFVTSFRAATAIVAMCGIPWSLACWAPFTFMGMEINKLNSGSGASRHGPSKSRGSVELHDTKEHLEDKNEFPVSDHGDLAGVYLGLLNVYTTLPQFIGTFISWIVFSILEPGKSPELAKEAHPDEHHSTDGYNAIAVCLFIGSLAAVIAAYATERFKKLLAAQAQQSRSID